MSILLTVAIPTYNGGENLFRAVNSCKYINLDHDSFEILVVDNCSNDGSIEKLEKLKNFFPNLRIIKNEINLGRVGNWNRCLDLAKGKYLIFLFNNDELIDGYDFKETLHFMDENPEIALVYNKVVYNYPDFKHEHPNYLSETQIWCLTHFVEKIFLGLKDFASFGILQQHIYRMETIRKFNLRFNEKIDRTTDRMFIFDCIRLNIQQKFLFKAKPIVKWNYSENRYHWQTHHSKMTDESSVSFFISLVNVFERSWLQELISNAYILEMLGYTQKKIIRLHYEKFLEIYYIMKIKSLIFRTKEQSKEKYTLPIFIEFLKHTAKLNLIDKSFICIKVLKNIIFRILNKILRFRNV